MAEDSFETVAITYSQPETLVILSLFEFYGIPVYVAGFQHIRTIPTWAVALGGAQIRVRRDALEDARELLAEVAERPQAVRPRLIEHPILNGIAVVLFGFFTGAIPPTRTGSTFFLKS